MKRIIISLVSIIVLAMMLLPATLTPVLAQIPPPPTIQLAMILDGSASIVPENWDIMINGLADAVENPECIPQNGTVELTIIQFADNISGGARVEVGPEVITASNATTVAAQIRAISQAGGLTPMACGIYLAADTLHDLGYFDPDIKQAINLVTDGEPNLCCNTSYDVSFCSNTAAKASAVTARDYALTTLGMTDNQDEFDAEFIGTQGSASDWLRDYIVYPQPGDYAPPFDEGEGWVRVVADATEFAETICEKFRVIVCPTVTVDDETVCDGETATLTAVITGTCPGASYQWYEGTSSSGTPISGATNSTYQTTTAGDYTCKVTCDNGCTAEDYGTVTTCVVPTASAPDVTLCPEDDLETVARDAGAGCSCGDCPCTTDSITDNGDGTYTVTCTNECGTDTATGNITTCVVPTASAPNVTLCPGDDLETVARDAGAGCSCGDCPCTTDSITDNGDGTYTVTCTNECGTDTATGNITILDCDDGDPCTIDECISGACAHTPNYPTADAGPDRTINYGGSVGIGGSPTATGGTPPYTYSWTPTTSLSNPTIANPIASPTSTTTYTVLVTDANGCTDTDSMTVTVRTVPRPCPDVYGPGGPACYFKIDMLGQITRVDVDCCSNTVLGTRIAPDPDDMHFLQIERDTLAICEECDGCECYPRVVVMSLATEIPPLPQGRVAIGPVYDFTGYIDIDRLIACTPVTFNSPISMVLSYDPDELPEGAHSPVIAYYDADLGSWVELSPDPGRVAEVGRIAVLADYFKSPFAILVEVPSEPTTPAAFELSNLNIVPSEIKVGENVTITVNVVNDGGQEGTYLVELKINGQTVDSEEVTLGAGQSEQVRFTVSVTEPGQYEVVVSELSGEFTVLRTINWWLIGGIIAAFILLVLVLVLGWLFWYRKRI